MIITTDHPDCGKIKVYGMNRQIMDMVQEVDTDTMKGKRFIGFDPFTMDPIIIEVDIFKIEGPNFCYKRSTTKRLINTGVLK